MVLPLNNYDWNGDDYDLSIDPATPNNGKAIFRVLEGMSKSYKVILQSVKRYYEDTYKGVKYLTYKDPTTQNKSWVSIDISTGLSFNFRDKIFKTKKECIAETEYIIDKITPDGMRKEIIKGIEAQKGYEYITEYEWVNNIKT